MIPIKPPDQAGGTLQLTRIGVENVVQQEVDGPRPPESLRRRGDLGQLPALPWGEGSHQGVGQIGEEGVQGQSDVVALLPEIVRQFVKWAGRNDDQRAVGAKGTRLLHPLAQPNGVRLVEQDESPLGQRGQHRLLCQHAIGIADQRERMGERREVRQDPVQHQRTLKLALS